MPTTNPTEKDIDDRTHTIFRRIRKITFFLCFGHKLPLRSLAHTHTCTEEGIPTWKKEFSIKIIFNSAAHERMELPKEVSTHKKKEV
jgi:hypothetical protein